MLLDCLPEVESFLRKASLENATLFHNSDILSPCLTYNIPNGELTIVLGGIEYHAYISSLGISLPNNRKNINSADVQEAVIELIYNTVKNQFFSN